MQQMIRKRSLRHNWGYNDLANHGLTEAGIATMASHLPSGLAARREIVVRPAAVKSPTTDQPVAPSRHNEIFEPDAISMPPSGNHVRYWLSASASVMTFVFLVAVSSSLITAGAPGGRLMKLTVLCPGRISNDCPIFGSITSAPFVLVSTNCNVAGAPFAPRTNTARR